MIRNILTLLGVASALNVLDFGNVTLGEAPTSA